MKSILVIVENSGLINFVINEVKENAKRGIASINTTANHAILMGENFRMKVVTKDISGIDKFGYDEVVDLTTKKLTEDMLVNLTKDGIRKSLLENECNKGIIIQCGETVSSNDAVTIAKAVDRILSEVWGISTSNENKQENQKDKSEAEKFDLNSIPLQLLSKVTDGTNNKEIGCILSIVRNIKPVGYYRLSDEGEELSRIEKILESKAAESLRNLDYKSLEQSIDLLRKVKDICKSARLYNSAIGRKVI